MRFRSIAVTATFAILAAILVPATSALADFGGLLDEEETFVASEEEESQEEGSSVIGELLPDGAALAATEYNGARVTISAKQTPAARSPLQGEDLDVEPIEVVYAR